MSQAGIISSSSSPPPPAVPTSFVTDFNSPSVPIANIEKVFGRETTANNLEGIQTDGSSGSNTLTIQLTNRATGTVTTSDATLTTVITFPLGATPGLYSVIGFVGGFIPASNVGGTYDFIASVRTNGAAGTLIGATYDTTLEDVIMAPSDIFANVSGNDLLIQVQGIAANTIDWVAKFEFTFVS